MDPEFADLVPLFVAEARGRLERLAALAPEFEESTAATAPEIRRELHTLKGAGRMLRLAPLAELCHAAEGLLQPPRPGIGALLVRVVDALTVMIEAVGRGEVPVADAAVLEAMAETDTAVSTEKIPTGAAQTISQSTATTSAARQESSAGQAAARAPAPPPAPQAAQEMRIAAETVDALADRATRLRIIALAAEHSVDRILELAHLAEQGVREEQPRQVLAALATALRRTAGELGAGQRVLLRTSETHLDALLALQVQPLHGFMLTLARHARELARSLGREVEVDLVGEETRLDRRIVRELEDALIHMVRNAVDHGIEPPALREAAGKPRSGHIHLEAQATGARVHLSLADDGAGIDPVKVAAAAVEAGLIEPSRVATIPRDEVLRLLFTPGFSTRHEVSEVSGRGVGLDAVAAAAARVGGNASIDSEPGRGTRVSIDVPAAKRGEVVLLLRAGNLRFALPSAAVTRVDALPLAGVIERDGRFLVPRDGAIVSFVLLARIFSEEPAASQILLTGKVAGQPMRLAVDAVEGSQEVLIRPLGRAVSVHPLIDSVTLLASGQPVAVLSPAAIANHETLRPRELTTRRPAFQRLRVLLVDDSLVTRQMERRLLEDAGFDVTTAEDAAEGLTRLAEAEFDCLVTDIEMPGMDGFELTRHVRTIGRLQTMPVVVVSTRDHPEDRLRGLEAGADAYLTKQGLDAAELTTVVRRLAAR